MSSSRNVSPQVTGSLQRSVRHPMHDVSTNRIHDHPSSLPLPPAQTTKYHNMHRKVGAQAAKNITTSNDINTKSRSVTPPPASSNVSTASSSRTNNSWQRTSPTVRPPTNGLFPPPPPVPHHSSFARHHHQPAPKCATAPVSKDPIAKTAMSQPILEQTSPFFVMAPIPSSALPAPSWQSCVRFKSSSLPPLEMEKLLPSPVVSMAAPPNTPVPLFVSPSFLEKINSARKLFGEDDPSDVALHSEQTSPKMLQGILVERQFSRNVSPPPPQPMSLLAKVTNLLRRSISRGSVGEPSSPTPTPAPTAMQPRASLRASGRRSVTFISQPRESPRRKSQRVEEDDATNKNQQQQGPYESPHQQQQGPYESPHQQQQGPYESPHQQQQRPYESPELPRKSLRVDVDCSCVGVAVANIAKEEVVVECLLPVDATTTLLDGNNPVHEVPNSSWTISKMKCFVQDTRGLEHLFKSRLKKADLLLEILTRISSE